MNTIDTHTAALDRVQAMMRARAHLRPEDDSLHKSPEAEGGCGVTGFACTVPVRGKHIYEPSIQMRNRGNGKGGGKEEVFGHITSLNLHSLMNEITKVTHQKP